MKRNIFCAVMMIAFVIFAAVSLGGCGGSSNNFAPNSSNEDNNDKNNQNDNQSYTNNIVKKLLEESTVTDLAEFLRDKTKTVSKGDILLYTPDENNSIGKISENTEYLTRINDALEAGAIVAFSDIKAEELDNIVDNLGLDVPPYLPDDAAEKEKNNIEDFYAVAARSDGRDPSDDIAVVDFYTFYGTELHTPASMDIHVYSGDEEIPFNPNEYTEGTVETVEYYIASEDRIVSNDPNPFKYDHVEDTVQDFFDWCDELDYMKSVKEVESSKTSAGSVRASAGEASATFPGVTASFNFVLNKAPRDYYYTSELINGKHSFTHPNPWHRETSMAFNIVPVHSFKDNSDYYIVQVTGNTDPSKQYAHPSHVYRLGFQFGSPTILEGLGTTEKASTSLWLFNDNVLGYNRRISYEASFKSGNNVVGTVIKSAPETINDSKKVSKGFTFQIDGNISGGIGCKDGKVEGKADMSIKPSWKWESKEEYTLNDYTIANRSAGQKAGWTWEFQPPADGERGWRGMWIKDASLAGRSSVSLKSEFLIQVTKDEWKKYPNLKLVVDFYSQEGGTEGGTNLLGAGNKGRRDWTYNWDKKGNEITLPRPPHIAVTQATFNYKATAAKGDTQTVMLQSEEDWTATANASWIHLTTSDNNTKTADGKESISGTATGSAQKQVMISVDPVTDGKPRGGKVVFKASDGETCTIEILQAGK